MRKKQQLIFKIRFPVGDMNDGHHQSRSWSFGLNRDIEEASVVDSTKKKRNRRPTVKAKNINCQHCMGEGKS